VSWQQHTCRDVHASLHQQRVARGKQVLCKQLPLPCCPLKQTKPNSCKDKALAVTLQCCQQRWFKPASILYQSYTSERPDSSHYTHVKHVLCYSPYVCVSTHTTGCSMHLAPKLAVSTTYSKIKPKQTKDSLTKLSCAGADTVTLRKQMTQRALAFRQLLARQNLKVTNSESPARLPVSQPTALACAGCTVSS
jgi:hypothetical protein